MSKVKPDKKITINPFTGELDYITDNNFSYQSVPLGKTLKIPANMQMTVFNGFIVDGVLNLIGSLILEP